MPAQLWVSVAELGTFFALIGLSYYVVVQGAGFFNFASGPYAMFAALCTTFLANQHGLPIVASAGVGLLCAVALPVVTEVLVIRPIDRASPQDELPALIGILATLYAIQQLAGVVFGRQLQPGVALVPGTPLHVVGVELTRPSLVLILGTFLLFVVVHLWMRGSRYGRMLRAVGDSRSSARILGLPAGSVRLVAFALSGLIAGIAGILFAPKAGVSFASGLDFSFSGFLAFVIGGRGSVYAPLVGGFALALMQVMVSYFISATAVNYAMLAVAALFFAVRPSGVFARAARA